MTRLGLPLETVSDNPIPERVLAYVSVEGPQSVFGGTPKKPKGLHKSPKAYHAKKSDRDSVRKDLEKNGFQIIAESALGLSVEAPGEAYEDITGGTLQPKERLMYSDGGYTEYITHLDIVGKGQPESLGVGAVKSKSLKVDGIVIERPRVYHAVFPSPIPPSSPKFHLRVPNDVASTLNALVAHQQGQRGKNVLVAMPDSGWFRHTFFTANGYKIRTPITVVPGTNRSKDQNGHGTAESANIFAVAPEAELQPIRVSNNSGDLVGAFAGFLKAKEVHPKIITCSWGGDQFPPPPAPDAADLAFATEIRDAIANRMLVVFSAGNGQFSIEPQIPEVLAAGGVFVNQNGDMRASDYASGYRSPYFSKKVVPNVCGLVGLLPRAQYIMLPLAPGCEIDRDESAPNEDDPTTDGTDPDDGWALLSGTSAAAPQLAGACAVLLGAKPNLAPAQVIGALTRTATDVVAGRCHPRYGNAAGPGNDLATGAGLINVGAALKFAMDNF